MISIIIPAYNHAHLLGETIRSVLAQTEHDWELIAINDGSPDNTADAIRPFLGDARIRYYEQDNHGQSATRNRGIGLARGEFIQLLDDDDLLPPDALAWKLRALRERPNCMAVVGRVQYIDAAGCSLGGLQGILGPISFDRLFESNAFASPGQAMFRKSALDEVGAFDPSLRGVDDYDFMLRLCRSHAVEGVHRCGLFYRWHGGNASAAKPEMCAKSWSVIQRHLATVPDHAQKNRLRRRARKYLHQYGGSEWLMQALRKAGHGDFQPLGAYWKQFGISLLTHPILCWRLLKSCIRRQRTR